MKLETTDKQQVIKFAPYFVAAMLLSIFLQGELLNLLVIVFIYLGYKFTPSKVWPSWLASVVLLWTTYGLSALAGIIPFEEGGETWWSFALEAFFFMGYLVAIPMWIGRWLKMRKQL